MGRNSLGQCSLSLPPGRFVPQSPLLVLGLCLFFLTGCGEQKYRQRLAETVSYFEYKDRIARELGREWSGKNIRFQPPKQFDLIPPPAPPQGNEEPSAGVMSADEDPRQPHYLGIELPGLVAAWRAQVESDGSGSEASHRASLFILSNHDRYLEEGHGDPQTFLADVERTLSGPIGAYITDGGTGKEKNQRYRETAPRGLPNNKYHSSQEFTGVTLEPQVQLTDVPIEMQLYEWKGQNIQVAILMVYPKGVSPREELHKRLLLALETFNATDTVPSRPQRGGTSKPSGSRSQTF